MDKSNSIANKLYVDSDEKLLITIKKKINRTNNKGIGAGGSNTNFNGKSFEDKTNNENRLLQQGFTKTILTTSKCKKSYNYYLSKKYENKTIIFVLQNGFKLFMKHKYNIINIWRCPDEAYIIEYNTGKIEIKILEKKTQNVSGSVETKLWASPSLKREYQLLLGDKFNIYYGLCVNSYLKTLLLSSHQKYTILLTILKENNIICLFGDDINYFETFDVWFNNSL